MEFPGIFTHTPGDLSRGAVLDVGLKCPHSCLFCYYSYWDGGDSQFTGLRKSSMRDTESCVEIVREIARNGLNHIDITGGEPTIHPGLVDIVAEATNQGVATRCITLGQFLDRKYENTTLLNGLLDAGLTDLLFSFHAADPASYKEACGGSLDKLFGAMDVLDDRGFQYGCNTVIMERNRKQLPEIAKMAVSRGIYVVNYIAFNAYHAWRGQDQAQSLQASYANIRPYLEEAIDILTEAGIAVNIRYAPLCAFPSSARHVVGVLGVPYDPFEWRNRCLNHDREPAYCAEPLPIPKGGVRDLFEATSLDETLPDGTDVCGMRGDRFKFFPVQCAECPAKEACDGVDPVYLERHGAGEFSPLEMSAQGPLLKARLDYLPPHLVKVSPDADMRGAISSLLKK